MGPFSEILSYNIMVKKSFFVQWEPNVASFLRAPWDLQTVRKHFGLVVTKFIILVIKHNFSYYSQQILVIHNTF